jgi:hypothetical protein
MATRKMWYLDEESLSNEATKIKNLVATFLYNEGEISEESCNDLCLNYGIIVKEPSFFSKLWKRKNVLQDTQYVIIKQMTIVENNETRDPKANLTVISSREEDKDE